ncbi:MAG: dTMP kinase, partial [Candidatus Eremiobacteraeota bacterium]|nr:dTMP kinase [Candidatus Eremiobacteraeota bacterium]
MTVEGIEGSGKSTLLASLAAGMAALGIAVVVTREPGGTALGNRLRAAFVEPGLAIDPIAEALIVNASRAQHVVEVIEPALAAGSWVLCDRFADATLAYQGY